MKQLKFQFPAFSITCLILIFTTASQNKPKTTIFYPGTGNEGFAVMELFTSQGCSSCPAADNLLGKYAARRNEHIIPLAFHVDYWNRLGWTDSFSSAKYSRRQRDYAMIIDHSSVYTPQLIINGEKEFVGSDAAMISEAITDAVKEKPVIAISIQKIERAGKNISVNYKLDKILKNLTLQAALVQKQVFTNILKGENRGLKLINYNVVRDLNSNPVSSSASAITLNIPPGYNDKDFEVVLYIQDDASGKIIAAIKSSF
ncbi:MAG: DUF1223 domain-containing protein [Ferruginibacter sp.]